MATVSDALPIQFWPVGALTFNNQVNPFVDKAYFYPEFLCSDTVKLQIGNESDISKNYVLKFNDKYGSFLGSVNFSRQLLGFGPNISIPAISDGATYWDVSQPSGWSILTRTGSLSLSHAIYPTINWTHSTPSSFATPYFLAQRTDPNSSNLWPPVTYNFSLSGIIGYTGISVSVSAIIKILGSNDGITFTNLYTSSAITSSGSFTLTPSVTPAVYYKYFVITADLTHSETTLISANFQFTGLSFTNSISDYTAEYDLEFVPNSLGFSVCDQLNQLTIQQNGSDWYKSDLVRFSSTIMTNPGWGTQLIQYKSTKNFLGINYPGNGNYFNIRIPARFFQQKTVSSQASLPLSNSQVINTSLTKKYQTLLETIYMPDYMLNKVELALAHAVRGSVMINGVEWTVDESFDRNSPDPKFAFQMGKVWLTRKNYFVRNVI